MKILVILGHPRHNSFNGRLAEAYADSARDAGAEVDLVVPSEMDIDWIADPRTRNEALEADVREAQARIERADHVVVVFPTWWGGVPAVLKGFIDRVFLTGWAYRYREGRRIPDQLLQGRTARIIVTSDAPSLWYRWPWYAHPGVEMIRRSTLEFCGIRVRAVDRFGMVRWADDGRRAQWRERTARAARRDVARWKAAGGRTPARRSPGAPRPVGTTSEERP